MEIMIIILLVILIGLILWYILRGQQRWKEQSDILAKAVGEKVEGGIGVFGEVRERLGELTKSTKDIEEVGKNISQLQEALRAPHFRGEFGEVGLETLLMNHLPGSYQLQYAFRNGKVVDAVVRVGEKRVPIDSKFPFPLKDFELMVTTESQEERNHLRRDFTRVIKKHIDDVSEYIQPDEGTFDFALLYISAENLYYETIIRGSQTGKETDLYSYCCEKRVFPVSPNTLFTYLRAIALGLQGLQVEKYAQEILANLQRIEREFRSFEQDYETLGGHIRHAANKHDEAGRKLDRVGYELRQVRENRAKQIIEGEAETSNIEELPKSKNIRE